jgi:hypothetical protein
MCVGFKPRRNGEIVFEEETPIDPRIVERTWRFRYPAKDGNAQSINAWRLEILVEATRKHLRHGHTAVVAQEPYSTHWIQTARFKKYSKKGESERPEPVVPKLKDNEHPLDWLERNLEYDLWEKGAHYVAGIGSPNGFQEESRNTGGRFVFGACPDFETLVQEMFQTRAVRDMLVQTEKNTINFWYSKADIANPPRLYPEVIEEAKTLMGLSIQQALAGPSGPAKEWLGKPVSRLVRWIYCNHLNDRNKSVHRRQLLEGLADLGPDSRPPSDDLE